jgi:5-methylcytosine-specific restriction endonuclease McrA
MSKRRLANLVRERELAIDRYGDGDISHEQLKAELERVRVASAGAEADMLHLAEVNKRKPWNGVAAGVTLFGGGRSRRHPPADAIARAQRHLWKRRFVTVEQALTHCWACTREVPTADLEKAHIHPVRFGGSDSSSNLLLLCSLCHGEQDDTASRAAQLRWLRQHKPFAEHWRSRLAEVARR